jgi:hypothetical protein
VRGEGIVTTETVIGHLESTDAKSDRVSVTEIRTEIDAMGIKTEREKEIETDTDIDPVPQDTMMTETGTFLVICLQGR